MNAKIKALRAKYKAVSNPDWHRDGSDWVRNDNLAKCRKTTRGWAALYRKFEGEFWKGGELYSSLSTAQEVTSKRQAAL